MTFWLIITLLLALSMSFFFKPFWFLELIFSLTKHWNRILLGKNDLPPSMKKHQQALVDENGNYYRLARIITFIMGGVGLVMVCILIMAEIFFVRK